MRKGSSGLDQVGAGTALASVRSASGLGRRTPKKNARKRIILQEKISRELSASRNKVSDGQVRCLLCANYAAFTLAAFYSHGRLCAGERVSMCFSGSIAAGACFAVGLI